MKKKNKRKPKYGLFSCVAYMSKKMWAIDKLIFISVIITIPFSILLSAINLYMPALIIEKLEISDTFLEICAVIVALMSARLGYSLILNFTHTKKSNCESYIILQMTQEFREKMLDLDRQALLETENQTIIQRCENAAGSNNSPAVKFPEHFSKLVTDILSFIFFGSVISMLNPLIFIMIAVCTVANFFLLKYKREKDFSTRDTRNALIKKSDYFYHITGNFQSGKDVRLYNFSDYFEKAIRSLNFSILKEFLKVNTRAFWITFFTLLTVVVRDGFVYFLLISKALKGELSAADFVLYVAAAVETANFMSSIINSFSRISESALAVSDYREFFDIKDKLNRSEGCYADLKSPATIEFRNVSYSYPKSPADEDNVSASDSKLVLDNVSFKINAGEKVALVGLNGAGKTTLTRLMCGLLLPTKGDVLINGHSIYEYNRDDLYAFFSLVPQQHFLMPRSIAENIAVTAEDTIDPVKLNECIRLAGLEDKVNSLENKADTLLDKRINKDAIELSGGEIQKLLLARALYRNSPVLILDEPTAALDPIAESSMYQKYLKFSQNCTSIFISHRLASTRFCDRIFLLDGASFAESGTHKELMAQNGKYKELFDVQSKYYKEGGNF